MCEGKCECEGITVEQLIKLQAPLEIGLAMELLQEGFRVRRSSWPENEWLKYDDNIPSKVIYPAPEGCDGLVQHEPCIYLIGQTVRPWEPRQADVLAEDWVVLG